MGGKGPPRPSSSESDDWGDGTWIVDCPCGVTFDDGEEMVDCDECGVWVHTACCKVMKGLPTYVCDKCKIKKKLKESEECEVAQLLADLPSKPVSFDERNHEKSVSLPLITGRHNSPDTSIEERVHVQGISGGDPSFFEGAPRLFCRQLWKYSGYVPKVFTLEYEELPEPRKDVVEFLRDVKEFEVVVDHDGNLQFTRLGLENGHIAVAPVGTSNSREEEVSKEQVQISKEALKDTEGRSLQARRNSKNRQKPKLKEEKPQQHSKRSRDEGALKEQSSKKKPRTNGDVSKSEEWDSKKGDAVAASQETGLLCKSPLSSPKNPKAKKKIAGLEYMDPDLMLCSVCGKVETLSEVRTGASGDGASDSLCQECEKVRRRTSPLSPKQETGTAELEPVVLPVPPVIDNGASLEEKSVSKRELEYCEEAVHLRGEGNRASPDADRQDSLGRNKVGNDSLTDAKKNDVDAHKIPGMHENLKGRDEKRRSFVKGEPNALTANHTSVDTKVGDVPEALELPAVRTVVPAKARGESASRAEESRHDGAQVVASRSSYTYGTETRAAGEAGRNATLCGNNRQAVSLEAGYLPVSSSDTASKPAQSPPASKPAQSPPGCSTVRVVPSNIGPVVPAERTDGNLGSGSIQDRVVRAVEAESLEDRASKLPGPTICVETKSQGSARTAGHLPASVRGKMHGDRGNSYIQRSASGAAGLQQASTHASQPLVQLSSCGTPRPAAHTSLATAASPSVKGSSGEDPVPGRQHGQAQQECISPVPQVSKQGQPSRLHSMPTTVAQKSPPGLSELSSPSQPCSSAQRIESDQQPPSKAQPGGVEPSRSESSTPAVLSPKEPPKVVTGSHSEAQVPKPVPSTPVIPTPIFCQQARQLNGIGHVYVSRKSMNSCIPKDPSGTLTSQALNSTVSNTKLSVSSLKSPSSGTSSSSPTSPLVTTPSSKPQPSAKVPESLPTQKSLSGGSNANASAPHSSSKLSSTTTSTVSSSKQAGTLQPSKSIPSPASPQSAKIASLSKQSSRSNSLQVTKSADGKNSGGVVVPSRGANHTGSSTKENAKNATHISSKTASKVNAQLAGGAKPPSSGKSSHYLAPTKGSSVSKHHSGPASGTAKASSTASTAKHTGSHQSKAGLSHKDEKSSMPSAPPVPKAMSTMPPPPPQVSTKRSPSTGLASAVATTLKDEELALLLHQELNSSPRVPRVPRVRQAGVSLQLVSSPSLSSAKGSFVSAASGGHGHKERHLAPRKRTREDRHKDTLKPSVEVGKSGRKRLEEKKTDGEKHSTEKGGHNGTVDGYNVKEKFAEGNSRHHGFAKGNLSIIVPGNEEAAHDGGDKKSPAHGNILTLPGLIDEVLGSGVHHLSYEDVCDAVLPHWPKLRKPNGERYAYPSHRQAVLDCLRNRPAWAHLVARGPKTHPGRKRPRNDVKSLSDSDDEENEHVGSRDADGSETGKSFKRRKASEGEKRAGADASERQKSSDAATLEDARKGGRQARRRRRVEIEDGTDGEDEPLPIIRKAAGEQPEVSKSDDGTSQEEEEEEEEEEEDDDGDDDDEEEEPEAESSPSSEDEASNYSTDDEEMVVHRGIRNRRRPTDESSSSEDDID